MTRFARLIQFQNISNFLSTSRSEVTSCDMVADNGVVHAIDRVMIPAQFTQSRRKIQVLL